MSLPHLWENDNEKMLLIAMMAAGPVACTTSPAPKEDTKLKDAYSACINTAEGNPDKIEACQSVLNVLKKDKQHQQFANRRERTRPGLPTVYSGHPHRQRSGGESALRSDLEGDPQQ